MSKDSLRLRLYFDPALYESARIIGYEGIEPLAFFDKARELGLDKKIGEQKLVQAVYDLTRADRREASPSRYELNAEARQACLQLLGPPPEHPLGDFLRHGPPDIMGEENAKRWQEDYRKRKEEEEKTKPEEQAQEQPKKKGRKGRGR